MEFLMWKSSIFFWVFDKYSLKNVLNTNTNTNTNAQQIHLELLTMQWSEYVDDDDDVVDDDSSWTLPTFTFFKFCQKNISHNAEKHIVVNIKSKKQKLFWAKFGNLHL